MNHRGTAGYRADESGLAAAGDAGLEKPDIGI
jgi:hypothetical protein